MFVVDIERFKALCALYFLNTIQPEELEELKAALNSGETELRKIFNQTKKSVKESPISGRFIDTYIDENESFVSESKLKDVWNYSFIKLFLSYWFSKIKIKLVLVISFLLLVSLIIMLFYTSQLTNEVKEMNGEIASQNSELNRKGEILSILQSKDMILYELKGQSINPEGYGKIIWSPAAKKAILQVADLPPAGKGKVYQLWLIKDSTYSNKGAVSLDNIGSENIFNVGNITTAPDSSDYSFSITLEKEGNASKPAGVVYLMGSRKTSAQ